MTQCRLAVARLGRCGLVADAYAQWGVAHWPQSHPLAAVPCRQLGARAAQKPGAIRRATGGGSRTLSEVVS